MFTNLNIEKEGNKLFFLSFRKHGIVRLYEKEQSNIDMSFSYTRIEKCGLGFCLSELYVSKKQRNKGLGKKLLLASIEFAKKRGKFIELEAKEEWCGTPFDKLKSFYENNGFKQIGNSTIFRRVF